MFVVSHELPDLSDDTFEFADRDFRRQLAVLVQQRATRTQLGSAFEAISIMRMDRAGDPKRLAFHFTGSNRHGAQQDVAAFMGDLVALGRQAAPEWEMQRTAVIRPLGDFRADRYSQALWDDVAMTSIRLLSSRQSLGEMFLRVDVELSSKSRGSVVFAFADFRTDDNDLRVEGLARAMRSLPN